MLDAANPSLILGLAALGPIAAAIAFLRLRLRVDMTIRELPLEQAVSDIRSVMALFFALLLFFQFANEWSIAGWLPVFLIDRLGMSPASAVTMLALYWLSLTAGRAIAAGLLTTVSHGRMLAAAPSARSSDAPRCVSRELSSG